MLFFVIRIFFLHLGKLRKIKKGEDVTPMDRSTKIFGFCEEPSFLSIVHGTEETPGKKDTSQSGNINTFWRF